MNLTERHHVLLKCEVGSGAHGVSIKGTDDRDEMGVCLEPLDEAFGLGRTFEQHIYRSAVEREGYEGAPSQPGDLDLTVYSLRKWCRLALNGNPTVLALLFAPIVEQNELSIIRGSGQSLRANAHLFASRRAGERFLGYLQSQRQRLLGERGQKNVNRKDLVDKFGFDTKYAGHMLRLGYQGVEYLETGKLQLPMRDWERNKVISVRLGEVSLQDVLTETGDVERQLKDLLTTSVLPAEPETAKVEEWMLDLYQWWWYLN